MQIRIGASAGTSGSGIAASSPPRNEEVRRLPEAYENELCQMRTNDVCFDVFRRAELLNDLIGSQGYLTNGWLAADSARPCPVIKLREEAASPDGVMFGEDNLGLGSDVIVLGTRDTQGGSDSYFLCHWLPAEPIEHARFFVVCVESGRTTGRYEIYVDGPQEWGELLDYLRA